jgi:hypothetical protein
LTCCPWKRDRRLKKGAPALPSPIDRRGVRGTNGEAPRSRKSCRALPALRASAGDNAGSYRSRRRAVKHAAVGGRMTARWSGVYHERRPDRPGSWRISNLSAGGFPTALGGESPKKVFSRRVLVSETSVVEADSKHRGGASKESREASRGAHRRATGRREAWTRPVVIHFAQRCQRLARCRKAESKPLDGCGLRIVGPSIEPRRPVPRRSIESVEGAWGLDTRRR